MTVTDARAVPEIPRVKVLRRPDIRTRHGWAVARSRRDVLSAPLALTAQQIESLPGKQRHNYALLRTQWHQQTPFIPTPMALDVIDNIDMILDANALSDSEQTRWGAYIDALGGQGKTTTVTHLAMAFEDRCRDLYRDEDDPAFIAQFTPVAWVACNSKTTLRSLCLSILRYYGEPPPRGRYSDSDLKSKVKDCLHYCETKLLVIDEVTRLRMHRADDQDVADFIRDLMDSPATVVGMGVDIKGSGLLGEGSEYRARFGREALETQSIRRFSCFDLPAFDDNTEAGIQDWQECLRSLQEHLVLANASDDMLIGNNMSALLMERTGGVIGSLTRLVQLASIEAITSGEERITPAILNRIVLSYGAEQQRAERQSATAEARRVTPVRRKGRNKVYDA